MSKRWKEFPSLYIKTEWRCDSCGLVASIHPQEDNPWCVCGDKMLFSKTLILQKSISEIIRKNKA